MTAGVRRREERLVELELVGEEEELRVERPCLHVAVEVREVRVLVVRLVVRDEPVALHEPRHERGLSRADGACHGDVPLHAERSTLPGPMAASSQKKDLRSKTAPKATQPERRLRREERALRLLVRSAPRRQEDLWDGVRNFEARNTLRAMKKGDTLLFYHSNEGKEIVGIARVAKEAYQDPTTDDDWSAIDIAPVKKLAKPVTLATLKAHPLLSKMALVKRGRIS